MRAGREAESQAKAQEEMDRLLITERGTLQSTDPRIVWDNELSEDDEDEGWHYEDSSFSLAEDANQRDWSVKPL